MRGHGAKFERKKEQAIAALLTHRTTEEAAVAVGIGISTLFRWLNEPAFKAAYLKARREAVSQAIARIQQATGAAGVTILKLMTDPNVPAAVRLRAAECVFSLAVKGIEFEDIERRLTELERDAEESRSTKK
jgi:cytosine/adenosine deaminase-related metal-dependent hydrolase